MFYLRYNDQYVCSKGQTVENKRGALPFKSYHEAVLYRNQIERVYKLLSVRIVNR